MDTSAIAIPAKARAAFEAEHELAAARHRAEREREDTVLEYLVKAERIAPEDAL